MLWQNLVEATLRAFLRLSTPILRLAFPLRCFLATLFYCGNPVTPRILRQLDPFTFAKRSRRHAVMREAEALKFIAQSTTIPVPGVYDVFPDKNDPEYGWLLMEYIPGTTLEIAWTYMSYDQRESVMIQLGDILRQLRSIPHPYPSCICSCTGGPIHDGRFAIMDTYGPFDSEKDFNAFMFDLAARNHPTKAKQRIPRQLDGHNIVFTHADFHPGQILLDSSDLDRVVAVLDWEWASWYPAYWEPMKADNGSRRSFEMGWKTFVESITGSFYEEEERNQALLDFQGLM